MKKTLLFSTLLIGIALTGCNRDTRTSTATTDTAAGTTPTTTSTAGTTTTGTTSSTASSDLSSDVRRGADSAAAATREAGRDVRDAARSAGDRMREAGRDASDALARTGDKLEAKYTEWKLNAQDLEADIAAKRPIVRTRSDASTAANVDRSTLKTAVEGRIKADAELSNLKLDINANRNGEVEFEGKAQNAQQIARAMALALDTDGVVKVTSKVRIDDDATKR